MPTTTAYPRPSTLDVDLWERARAEYLDMPGLGLTLPQACRLWNTNFEVGRHVLEGLVESAFLRRSGERYVRSDLISGASPAAAAAASWSPPSRPCQGTRG